MTYGISDGFLIVTVITFWLSLLWKFVRYRQRISDYQQTVFDNLKSNAALMEKQIGACRRRA